MGSIATTVLATDRASAAAVQSTGTGVRHVSTTGAGAGNPATSVTVSNLAKSLFGAFAGPAGTVAGDFDPLRLPESFDAMVQARTEALAAQLAEDFAKDGMMLDVEMSIHVDASGTITAKGPYKERIEKYFKDNPEVAQEFKTVAMLNTMRAVAEALRLYDEEMKGARTEAEKSKVFERFTSRLGTIRELSGSFTFKDGQLTSAAMTYADSLSESVSDGQGSGVDRMA